jgi:hypothetical protein
MLFISFYDERFCEELGIFAKKVRNLRLRKDFVEFLKIFGIVCRLNRDLLIHIYTKKFFTSFYHIIVSLKTKYYLLFQMRAPWRRDKK